jgi:diguanylate cyclase (GGDEF)-like protein/PAS domain S-box-containing protein
MAVAESTGGLGPEIIGLNSDTRLQALLGSIADALITVDERGAIESVNPAAEHLFGYESAHLVGAAFAALLSDPHRDEYEGYLRDFANGVPVPILGTAREVLGRRSDGAGFPLELTLTEVSLGERMLVAIGRDITERKRAEEKLRMLADFDPLTGLLNRHRFEQELDKHISYSERYGTGGSVLVLDVDNFKYVNDTLGSRAGDELLGAIAALLRGRLRKTDVLARLGGDEFGMLLHGADAEKSHAVAESVLGLIGNNPFVIERQSLRATVSGGLATIADDGISASELVARADYAKYQAKEAGRNRVAHFDPSGETEENSVRVWSDRVREAIEQGRFVIHAQPILDMAKNKVSQYELLIRMRGEDGELVPPAAFLDTAERFNLIQGLDRWMANQAIRLMESHKRAGHDLVLEVNLSGKTLADQDFATAIGREMVRAGVEPSNLIFEVTETAAVADIEQARSFAESLTRMGCQFALDDFGSGFASFYYLKHLPISILKIDGEFVKDLPRAPNDQLIVKALVEVADGMGMKTVAEYVEEQATLDILRGLGVTYAQGFHIGRPAPVGELAP